MADPSFHPPILYPARLASFNVGPGEIDTFTLSSYTGWLITKLHIVVAGAATDFIIVYMNGVEFDNIPAPPATVAAAGYQRDYWMTLLSSDSVGLAIQSPNTASASGYFAGYTFAPQS